MSYILWVTNLVDLYHIYCEVNNLSLYHIYCELPMIDPSARRTAFGRLTYKIINL